MTEYSRAVKRGLRDQYGFKPKPGSTDNESLLDVPDGEYPMTIDGKLDKVRVVNGKISCCNFEEVSVLGCFHHDASGLCHYHVKGMGGLQDVAEDAVKYRQNASWFWFNGTPAPIQADDTMGTLVARWHVWRETYQNDPKEFLTLIAEYAGFKS